MTTPGYGTHPNGRSRLSLNNLKGIFFRDDDLEQMTFSGDGAAGETGITILRISAFQEVGDYDLAPAFPPAIFAIHKDSVIDFYMLPCYNNIILAGPWDMGPWEQQERSLRSLTSQRLIQEAKNFLRSGTPIPEEAVRPGDPTVVETLLGVPCAHGARE